MNIKQAKEQIRNTLRAYLSRDELGNYRIPAVRQRPVLIRVGHDAHRVAVDGAVGPCHLEPAEDAVRDTGRDQVLDEVSSRHCGGSRNAECRMQNAECRMQNAG